MANVNKNGASNKEKINQIGADIEKELKDYSYDERVQWIKDKKDQGDKHFRDKNHTKAVDTYMEALCGFNF